MLAFLASQYIQLMSGTKFAVEGLSESIAYELEPFGIKVILIEPGFVRTNFIRAMVVAQKAQDPASPYSKLMQKLMANASELAKNASDADFVANIILDAAFESKSQSSIFGR